MQDRLVGERALQVAVSDAGMLAHDGLGPRALPSLDRRCASGARDCSRTSALGDANGSALARSIWRASASLPDSSVSRAWKAAFIST